MVIRRVLLCGSRNGRKVNYFQVRWSVEHWCYSQPSGFLHFLMWVQWGLAWTTVLDAACRGLVAGFRHFRVSTVSRDQEWWRGQFNQFGGLARAIHAEKDVLSHTWLCGHTERRDVVAGFSWACSCCLLATLLVSAVPLSCATLRQGQSTIRV